jgi:hypothetical protein
MNLKGLLKRTFFFKNPNFSLGVTLIFLPALFFDRKIRVISFILIVILFFIRKINNKLNKIYKVSGIHLQRRAFKNSFFDTVLIGGSNAYFGINTSLFNNINCINLSIPAEDGDFENYCFLLKRLNIKSDKIIYSTLHLTQLSNKNNLYLKSKNLQLNKNNKLKESFINFQNLRKINILPERKHYYFDNLGNIFFDKNLLYLSKFAYAEYNDFDYSVADFFLKKIDVFLDIFNSSKIYLVFPNICVKHSDLEKWNNYLNEFKEFMKKQKVKIIFYHKTFYTEKDRELFLDTYGHPDNFLRDKNSLEINNFIFKNN